MPRDMPPAGTVTFLFTDVEGSTRLWDQSPEFMREALPRHDAIAEVVATRFNGSVVKRRGEGDSLFMVFGRAADGVAAAIDLQRALVSPDWPEGGRLKVRMSVHTGDVDSREGDYYGSVVNRAARIRALGHGGQILVSGIVRDLVADRPVEGVEFRDLGHHKLRDLSEEEHIYQVIHPDLPAEFPPLRSLSVIPNNLPNPVTSFIGREKQIAELRALTLKGRLVTVTGTGGTGKTRLTLEVAADLMEHYPDGVWFLELAPETDSQAVPRVVADVFGFKEQQGVTLVHTLVNGLRDKRLLLIFDNCEHLLEAGARLAAELIRQCRSVHVLCSSREALGISGEQLYGVPPLSVPDPTQLQTTDALAQIEAVRLFVDRANLSRPGFELTDENARAIAALCFHLDGIPLAIELAAARVRSLTVHEIERRLEDRFRLLTGGSRLAMPRQQTLRALIDWSYDLLNSEEARLFAAVSAFSGGWSMDAAEHVCGGVGIEAVDVVDLMSSLVGKNLVVSTERYETSRYKMLETVREYATEKLAALGQAAAVFRLHRAYYSRVVRDIKPNLIGHDQRTLLDAIDLEFGNIRQALTSCLETSDDLRSALQLAVDLHQYWVMRSQFREGRERLRSLLNHSMTQDIAEVRADALNVAGVLAYNVGDYAAAKEAHTECLAIKRRLDDKVGISNSLNNLGNIAREQGDYETAQAAFQESLALRSETGNQNGVASSLNNLGLLAWNMHRLTDARSFFEESMRIKEELEDDYGVANALNGLGLVVRDMGDFALAHCHFERSLILRRALHDRSGIAMSLNNLGMLAQLQGDLATAHRNYTASLKLKLDIGDQRGILYSLEMIAGLAVLEGDFARAVSLWGAASRLREAIGASMPPSEREQYEADLAIVRAALDPGDFAEAWGLGREIDVHDFL